MKLSHIHIKGFTLAELLIALAILGVIATFTIPKILHSQNDSKRTAIFKETIATLSEVLYQGRLVGAVSDDNMGSYFIEHLNAIKICNSDSVVQGCWSASAPTVAAQENEAGVVLASGAYICGLDDFANGSGADTIAIDWNGEDGPNIEGDDIMVVRAIIDNSTITDRVGSVRGDSSSAASRTLWYEIFQQ